MLDSLEVEIKSWDNAYSFSSEEDGKKRTYTIYSPQLRQKLREIIFPCEIPHKVKAQYKGKNSYGDRIVYQPGKDDLPDQLTLISREIIDQQEIDEEREEKKKEVEWEQRKEKWKEIETEQGISPNSFGTRGYFCGRDDKGNVVYEGTYFRSETQSHLITLENKKTNYPQIQQIADEKAEKKSKEVNKSLVKHEEEKDDKETVFTPHHQIIPKK